MLNNYRMSKNYQMYNLETSHKIKDQRKINISFLVYLIN